MRQAGRESADPQWSACQPGQGTASPCACPSARHHRHLSTISTLWAWRRAPCSCACPRDHAGRHRPDLPRSTPTTTRFTTQYAHAHSVRRSATRPRTTSLATLASIRRLGHQRPTGGSCWPPAQFLAQVAQVTELREPHRIARYLSPWPRPTMPGTGQCRVTPRGDDPRTWPCRPPRSTTRSLQVLCTGLACWRERPPKGCGSAERGGAHAPDERLTCGRGARPGWMACRAEASPDQRRRRLPRHADSCLTSRPCGARSRCGHRRWPRSSDATE